MLHRKNLPDWERLWDDCIQNEIRKNHLGAAKQVEEDENVALLARGKKGRAKKQASNGGGKGKGKGKQQNKEKDYSKSNVGIVKSWDTMLLCVRRRRTRKGKTNPWQLLLR